jgi:hypothetical protein
MRLLYFLLFLPIMNYAREATNCKVEMKALAGKYEGSCKNGYADGKGEATGLHHYSGNFKNGWPNGKGIYKYNDSTYYTGLFQEGLREGKGEMHYMRNGKPDSLVKGYWSANEYQGDTYKTYSFSGEGIFDLTDISPSAESGNTLTIEISTTSGAPDGTPKSTTGEGFVLTITDLVADDSNIVREVQTYSTASKFSATYQISGFPVKLQVSLSNGRTFNLELFKPARWTARLYMNK